MFFLNSIIPYQATKTKKSFITAGNGYLELWIGFIYGLVALLILVPAIINAAAIILTLVTEQKLKVKKHAYFISKS